jgi:hypothetical protein
MSCPGNGEELRESYLLWEFVLEGELKARRENLLQVLTLRFGEERAKEFAETLEGITHLARLTQLFKLAITARRLCQFRKALAGLEWRRRA